MTDYSLMDPDGRFEHDVPERLREDAMIQMCEEAHSDGTHSNVTILERDRINAINVRVHGIIEIDGEEYTFQMEDGDRNGTELLDWNGDREFERHEPTRWTLQPIAHLVDDAVTAGNGAFLLAKWDAFMKRPEIASIPDKYSYDNHFAPGLKTQTYWRDKAAEHLFEIVCEETASETRARLAATSPSSLVANAPASSTNHHGAVEAGAMATSERAK